MREIIIRDNDAGQRLDKFLSKAFPSLPKAMLYRAIRQKKIKRNRKRAEPGDILLPGDSLLLFLPEDVFAKGEKREGRELSRIKTKLRIVYEDENLLLLDKRAGVTAHEDDRGSTDTLLTAMQAYLYSRGEYNPEDEQSFAPALCNRLDRNTAGIIIAAKNARALREMNELIRDRRMRKLYLCAVHGVPQERAATLQGYLKKDSTHNEVRIFDKNPPRDAKKILTRYRVLAEKGGLSLLQVELLTGRTHQIRAHLAHIGHPLLGEGKYGCNREDRALGYRHQALASYALIFPHMPGEGSLFQYLAGRCFSLAPESIPFLSLFDDPQIGVIPNADEV